MKRRHGKPYYLLQAPVAVYLDGELLGDDRALLYYITKKYTLEVDMDAEDIAEKELIKYFTDIIQRQKVSVSTN
jgi:hypothetical protein